MSKELFEGGDVLRLRGLPWSAGPPEVAQFLHERRAEFPRLRRDPSLPHDALSKALSSAFKPLFFQSSLRGAFSFRPRTTKVWDQRARRHHVRHRIRPARWPCLGSRAARRALLAQEPRFSPFPELLRWSSKVEMWQRRRCRTPPTSAYLPSGYSSCWACVPSISCVLRQEKQRQTLGGRFIELFQWKDHSKARGSRAWHTLEPSKAESTAVSRVSVRRRPQ